MAGSQFLYGPEALETVENRAKEKAMVLSRVLLNSFIYKVTAKANPEITSMVVMSPDNDVDVRAMVKVA